MKTAAKDFQCMTAERILHIYKDLGHKRVLLADEVGLGKTFVARQVINLVRKWHREILHDDFFKVVYICSNANIADQNIEKLGVANKMNISESRLSMQHLYISLSDKKANAIDIAIEGDNTYLNEMIINTPTSECLQPRGKLKQKHSYV